MLGETFLETSILLANDFKALKQFHQVDRPDLYPTLTLKDFLKKYLPKKYGLDSGFTLTLTSPQVQAFDLVIYDKDHYSNIGQYLERNTYPMESLYGVIEVLEDLTEENLQTSIENLRRFKSLDHAQSATQKAGIIFAYKSNLRLEEITSLVDRLTYFYFPSQRPNAIFILDAGLVVPVKDLQASEPALFVEEYSVYAYFKSRKYSLIIFYIYLVSLLNHVPLLPLNLYRYAQEMGFFGQGSSIHLVIPPQEEALKSYQKEKISQQLARAQRKAKGQSPLPENIDKYFQRKLKADELLEYLIENHSAYSRDLEFFKGDFLKMVYNSYDLHKIDCYRDASNSIRSHQQREFNNIAREIYNIYLRIDASKL